MIRAKVNGHALTWDAGELTVESPDAGTAKALAIVFMRGHSAFNPEAGGPYIGFDRSDPVHVLDALKRLQEWGHDVEIEEAEYERGERPTYPGGHDDRNELSWARRAGPPHEDPFPVDDE